MPNSDNTIVPAVNREIPPESILEQMRRILADRQFQRSGRNTSLLEFVVTETLAGRAENLTSHRVALEVMGRDETFDPVTDPIVRNQVSRLRRALERYYFNAGADDPVRIEVPVGGCVPAFSLAADADRRRPGKLVADATSAVAIGPTIAVLPFNTIGEDRQQEFFADGLIEELIVELTRFRDFNVIGRRSAAKYKSGGVDLREVGRELDVRFVLTGSIQRSADRIRIAVKLADTQTGEFLWAERFDGDLAAPDILDIQDGIVSKVVASVADSYGVIPRALSKASSTRRTTDLTSYEAVLRFHHYAANISVERFWETRKCLESAVERDPRYAPAWAKLSELLSDGYWLGYSDEPDLLDRAMEYARRAIRLDRESQDGHVALVWCHFQRRDRPEVLKTAAKVIELNPNAALSLGFAGFTIALVGEWDEGLALIDTALRLNPHNPGWLLLPRYADHLRSAEYEEALETAREIDSPSSEERLIAEAAALGHLGRTTEGERVIATLLALRPGFDQMAASYVRRLMFLDELVELMLEGLQKAGLTPGDL